MSMSQREFRRAGIAELAAQLRSGAVSSRELAEIADAALREHAAPLNAVAVLSSKRAAAEAAAADAELHAGIDRGALHGLPYGAKDLIAARGLPTTWGAAPLKDQQFADDAEVVRRLQLAGAVLTAKLATVELAGGGGYRQPHASLQGPGRNPWNAERWTGGSSSGSGAAVGAGAVPFALGSETWGSIVLPAAYCGIVGLRPSYGLVPRLGAMALSWSMDKIGPLARSVADAARVLEVIAGPHRDDPSTNGSTFRYQPQASLRRPRFGLVSAEIADAAPDIGAAFERLRSQLATIGDVVELDLADEPHADVAWLIVAAEAASAYEDLIESGAVRQLAAAETHAGFYSYESISAKDYIRAQRVRRKMVANVNALFNDVDVLIAPTSGRSASPIHRDTGFLGPRARPSDLGALANLAGMPGFSLPIGLDREGLPLAMHVVAPFQQDAYLVAVAERIEALLQPYAHVTDRG
jgi:aspartyl-tRNA(Asn)/glutamyl-tRNA(Gln) amidotransferase subunit A